MARSRLSAVVAMVLVLSAGLAAMANAGVLLPDGTPDPNAADFQLWLRGDAGVYKDATTLAALGDTVHHWANQATTGVAAGVGDAVANGGYTRPTLQQADFNGTTVQALRYDGQDQLKVADHLNLRPQTGGFTVFALAKQVQGYTYVDDWFSKGNRSSGMEGYRLYTNSSTGAMYARVDSDHPDWAGPSHAAGSLDKVGLVTMTLELTGTNQVEMRLNGSTAGWAGDTIYVNDADGINNADDLGIGVNTPSPTNTSFQGDYAEVLVYNSTLSDDDRVGVENYLKLKYGAVAPTDSPVTDDLVVHLDAAYVTPDGTGNVEVWNNRAGAMHSAIQATAAQRPTLVGSGIGGLPTLSFDGGDVLSIADDDMLDPGTGGYTVIAVGECTDNAVTKCWLSKGNQGSGDLGYAMWTWSGGTLGLRARDSGGDTAAQATNFVPATPSVFTCRITGSELYGYRNSSDAGWGGSDNDYTGSLSTSYPVRIGAREGSLTYAFKGNISEVLMFKKDLPVADRVAVENHLQLKYGFIPTSDAPVQSGLVVHLDADYVTTDGSGNVEVWNNRAGALHSALQTSAAHRPALVPDVRMGHNAVRFLGGSTSTYDFLSIPDHDDLDVGAAGYTVFMVGQADDDALHAWITKGNSGSTSNGYSLWSVVSSGWGAGKDNMAIRAGNGGTSWMVGQETDPTDIYVVSLSISSGQIKGFLNGVEFDDVLNYTGSLANANDLLLGARLNASYWFEGDLFEVLLYNRALEGAESYQVTRYLMEKYNIPEPTTLALLGGALVALARRRRRR